MVKKNEWMKENENKEHKIIKIAITINITKIEL